MKLPLQHSLASLTFSNIPIKSTSTNFPIINDEARKLLAKDELDLEDIIYRSYGILTNCRKISYEEASRAGSADVEEELEDAMT